MKKFLSLLLASSLLLSMATVAFAEDAPAVETPPAVTTAPEADAAEAGTELPPSDPLQVDEDLPEAEPSPDTPVLPGPETEEPAGEPETEVEAPTEELEVNPANETEEPAEEPEIDAAAEAEIPAEEPEAEPAAEAEEPEAVAAAEGTPAPEQSAAPVSNDLPSVEDTIPDETAPPASEATEQIAAPLTGVDIPAETSLDEPEPAAEPAPIGNVCGAQTQIGKGDGNGITLRCGDGTFYGWSDFYVDLDENRALPDIGWYQPERAGYRFTGWSLSSEGGALLSKGDIIPSDNTEVFAQYVRVVTLDAGPGNFTDPEANNNYTRTVDLEGNALPGSLAFDSPVYDWDQREDLDPAVEFVGWYTEKSVIKTTTTEDGCWTWSIEPGGEQKRPGNELPEGVLTLYAGYQGTEKLEDQKFVTYYMDYNGVNGMWGNCLTVSRKVPADSSAYPITPGDLAIRYLNWNGELEQKFDTMEQLKAYWAERTFNGYTFLGWATSPTAQQPNVDDTTQMKDGGTIYAVWKRDDDGTNSWTFHRVDPAAGPVEGLHVLGLNGSRNSGSMTWSAHKAKDSTLRFTIATTPARATFDSLTWTVSDGKNSTKVTFQVDGGSVSGELDGVSLTADGRELTVTCNGDDADSITLTVDVQATVNGKTVSNSGMAATALFTHNWKETGESTDPTCTTPGWTKYECNDCDKTTAVKIGAPGHHYDFSINGGKGQRVIKKPTCTEPGEKEFTCTRPECPDKEKSKITRETSPLGHDFKETVKHISCIQDEITKTCQRDGCKVTTTEKVKASNPTMHQWTEWTVTRTATETATGLQVRSCRTCGARETKEIPKKTPKPTPKPVPTPAASTPTPAPAQKPVVAPTPTPVPVQKPVVAPTPAPAPVQKPVVVSTPAPAPVQKPVVVSTPAPAPAAAPAAAAQETASAVTARSGVEGFVERLYTICLGRSADDTGMADWTAQLTSHTRSGTEVASGFVFSEEFQNKGLSDAEYVRCLYRAILGREADDVGLADWVGRMQSGTSRADIFYGFAGSNEFGDICSSYGITRESSDTAAPAPAAAPAAAASGSVQGFVERLYSICLDRSADATGMADWSAKLTSHAMSGTEVASGFVFSEEFHNKGLSDAEYVQYLYRAILGREADPVGLADWVGRMQSGTSREDIFYGFAGSNEFGDICASYGILR